MNLLYISQSEIPSKSANSIHVMKMCSALAKNKFIKVDLFCLNRSNEKRKFNDLYKLYLVKKNFKILNLKVSNFWILRELKIILFILYSILRKNYEIIYSRSIQISWILGVLGIRTVLEVHSPPSKKTVKFLSNILKTNKITKLIVINNALKKYFTLNFNINQNLEILVFPDAADELVFERKKIKSLKIKKNSVGYLGHLYEGRGIDLIIRLSENLPNNNFYIVGGENAYLEYWKKKIKSKNIFFLGFKKQLDCNHLRKKFDILIAPYQKKVYVHGSINQEKKKNKTLETSEWMSPLKLFEYMSAKKPIITSNLKSINEILTNNHDAILCDPQNFDEWKKAIERINRDKNFKKKISQNAYNKFINKFTWFIRAKKILAEYKKLNITIFNFSLDGGGTEYMLSTLYNKFNDINTKKYDVNLVLCKKGGHYDQGIKNKNNIIFFNKTRVIYSFLSLYKFLKKSKSKILITSMLHTNVLAILLKLILYKKIKVIIRESNTISLKFSYENSFKSRIINWIAKKIYNKADAIVAPTNFIKKDLINNYNVKSSLIYKIPNPYNFKEIEILSNRVPKKEEKKLMQNDYLLSIGRLHPQKNFSFLIDVFKYINSHKKFKNLKLYILGDGKEKINLKKKIKFLKLEKNIKLLGFKSNPFIFMKKCKLFISTSIYEGHSNVLVHAQYLKNNIISSLAGGANKEVLSSNGKFYRSSNAKTVANLVINTIKEKKKFISKDELLKKFNDQKILSEFEKIFSSL
jgi:glycosyltransferase involved in cell wall biosynthesis